ncbi:MAG TPA: hypothetical protein VJ770_04525 [Stellaceae bacterium]|nr:hypothetical protein [Stellaceae bacterium]
MMRPKKAPLIPGVAIAMAGKEWIVPPLTLGQMRRLLPQVQRLRDAGASIDAAEIDVIIELVTAALQRNYPEMTPDKVAEAVDLGNARAAVQAILFGSGLRTSGEGKPAATPDQDPGQALNGISAESTASSPPAADIPFRSSTR